MAGNGIGKKLAIYSFKPLSWLGWAMFVLGAFLGVYSVFTRISICFVVDKRENLSHTLSQIAYGMEEAFEGEASFGDEGASLVDIVIQLDDSFSVGRFEGQLIHSYGDNIDVIARDRFFEVSFENLMIEDCQSMIRNVNREVVALDENLPERYRRRFEVFGVKKVRMGAGADLRDLPMTAVDMDNLCFDGMDLGFLIGELKEV